MGDFMCDPARLFHCTPKENVAAIMREGLKAPASLTIGWHNAGFVGDITNADELAVFEVHAWDQIFYPDSDGPGHVQIKSTVRPEDLTLVRTIKRPRGGW